MCAALFRRVPSSVLAFCFGIAVSYFAERHQRKIIYRLRLGGTHFNFIVVIELLQFFTWCELGYVRELREQVNCRPGIHVNTCADVQFNLYIVRALRVHT